MIATPSYGPLVVADVAGGPWPDKVREAATALSGREDDDEGVALLADIRTVFHEHNANRPLVLSRVGVMI